MQVLSTGLAKGWVSFHLQVCQSRDVYPYVSISCLFRFLYFLLWNSIDAIYCLPSGIMIYGLDVTYQAWKTVGKYPWLKIIRLPIIRFFADCTYTFFAKYRQPISRFLMPNSQCKNNKFKTKSEVNN